MAPPSTADKWPLPEAYDDTIITIIVGEDLKTYRVHKGILIFHSGFFEKALQGGFAEASTEEVRLPNAEPEVFDAVQQWMYS